MNSAGTIIISAERHQRLRQFLKDLWDYRELFWSFVQRDIKVRYKQTAMGVTWVILQPLLLTGVFSLIFGKIARMPTDGLPYVLFYLGALIPWNTFGHSLSQSALSLEAHSTLITKVYFPRVVVPGAIIAGSFLDFSIGWALLNAVALWMGYWHWQLLAITPLLILIQGCTAFGLGLPLAALNAQYRDVKHTINFLVQTMMLLTPVIYPLSRLPEWVRPYMFLNPMAAVVTTYRAGLQGQPFDWMFIGCSFAMAVIYLSLGLWFFRKRELRLADML